MKISSFIIVFLIISLVTVVFAFFLGALDESYDTVDLNDSELDAFDKVDELNELANDMNESLTQIQQGSSIDIVGGLLTSGFTVLKTTWTSFDIYTDVTSEAVDKSNLGESAVTFKAVALILGILLFIFAMVSVLTGRAT